MPSNGFPIGYPYRHLEEMIR